jgi:hypothetical protein
METGLLTIAEEVEDGITENADAVDATHARMIAMDCFWKIMFDAFNISIF